MLKGLKGIYNAAVQHGEDIWYGINFPSDSPEEKAIHTVVMYTFGIAALAGITTGSPILTMAGGVMVMHTSTRLAEMGGQIRLGLEASKFDPV